eukprot:CAMPEP_0185017852 /NCGR_PEP_ID=MMETSP1103-20130426/728_1 /TAXON_ID=36769 /ORGANISM="Paraphysomonas bandaiensis, Strain Caron Lab Isolate" /LENGTH=367 /DNA_ID=CAMNT_0027547445 /DNA_START=58 /DNA_END=1161 /DNA_ORIENTATION=+
MTDKSTNKEPFEFTGAGFSVGESPAGEDNSNNQIQTQMKNLNISDVEVEGDEEFPQSVINRLVGLKQIQEGYDNLDAQYKAERVLLERKYHELRKPLFEQRLNVVIGNVDVEIVNENSESSPAAESEEKGIPNFWLQCMSNHPLLSQLISEEDHPALACLVDIRCEYNEDYSGFKLRFSFIDNDFFTNTELVKSYTVSPDLLDDKAPALTSVEGTEIQWKPKKNLCVTESRKKQKGKSGKKAGQVRYVTTEVAKQSFFHFFADPHMEEDSDDEEADDSRQHEFQLSVDSDYEVGHAFRAEIIPNAVSWFTGEALDDLDDDDDDDILDDEEDDDDDDDGDSPDEESEETEGRATGAAPAGDQPECKQS